jgi:hypothetical protein
VNCLEFRRAVGAEPFSADRAIEAHAAGCPACARNREELRAMDALLARAMRVDPAPAPGRPASSESKAAGGPASIPQRWLAMAASLVAGVLIAATLWLSHPEPSLAGEVIGHASHEPDSWTAHQVVAEDRLEEVLGPSGVRLRAAVGTVTYARRCFFERHWVPHLVVQTGRGPVTVFLLGHRQVDGPARVEEQGFVGVVLPAPRGSIAVVGRDVTELDTIARQVFDAVDWNA